MAMRYPGGLIATSPVNAAYPSGVWTQSQTIPYASQNVWQQDQYWRNTTLLLHGDGTNGAQNNTFLDSSSNNFTITRNGNTTQGAFTPYQQNGYWSNYFADTGSSNANYFSRSISGALSTTLSGSTQTREFWINRTVTSTSTFAPVIRILNGDQGTIYFSGGELRVYNGAVIIAVNWDTYVPVGVWTHIAVTQSGGTVTLWINGVSRGTSSSTWSSTGTDITIGGASDGLSIGYVSNLRISNSARYSSAFTPSTTPFANDGNTTLLICQSNRFVDNSSNAFTFTNIGTPSVQAFQPFPGPTTWSASVLGGSGYFDSSGDSLTQSGSTIFNFSGDYTVEFWIYSTGTVPGGGFGNIVGPTSGGSNVLNFGLGASNVIGSSSSTTQYNSSTFLINYQWNHIAYCRTGSTLYILLNGARIATLTAMSGAYSGGSGINICSSDAYGFKGGYLADVRVTSGAMLYPNSTYTVPTSPLTTTVSSGTVQLLTNFTNAGIFDNAQMNDLETVGNAQVSTSVVKYGTGSMYFDGSSWLYDAAGLLDFGTGDFTIEFWVYRNSTANGGLLRSGGSTTSGSTGQYFLLFESSNTTLTWQSRVGVTNQWGVSSTPLTTSAWHHIAVVRQSGVFKVFFNGTSQSVASGSFTDSTSYSCAQASVGGNFSGYNFNGYIDDLRITKGVARYTANFTPPIARMPNQ